MCGSKWDTLTGYSNAFAGLGSSTARYGCCPAGKYMSSPEVNPFSIANSCSDHLSCGVGKYGPPDNDETVDSIFNCNDCPTGQYQNQNVQASCNDCLTGKYQDQLGQTGCNDCPTGQYQNQNVQASCKDCPTGQYQDETSITTGCKGCAPGHYQDFTGQGTCKGCPNGWWELDSGSRYCKLCGPAKFAAADKLSCDNCDSGTYEDKTISWATHSPNGPASCSPCPTGWYTPSSGQTVCVSLVCSLILNT